jgi:hypothetical protein
VRGGTADVPPHPLKSSHESENLDNGQRDPELIVWLQPTTRPQTEYGPIAARQSAPFACHISSNPNPQKTKINRVKRTNNPWGGYMMFKPNPTIPAIQSFAFGRRDAGFPWRIFEKIRANSRNSRQSSNPSIGRLSPFRDFVIRHWDLGIPICVHLCSSVVKILEFP